jgi:hypothetical protein
MKAKKRLHGYWIWFAALLMNAWLPVSGAAQAPAGWFKAGSNPGDYEMGTDQAVVFNGKASGYIKSNKPDPQGFGTYMQMFDATDFRDKRMRLSAVVKSESLENWAGLWMRVDGQERSTAFDNMQNRPIKGTLAWTIYSVVLDVDSKAKYVAFGILLTGRGAVWINDVRFEAVGTDVPVTDMMKSALPAADVMDVSGWGKAGDHPNDYDMGIDRAVVFAGKTSGYIRSNKPDPQGFGTYMKMFDAAEFRDKRMRFSGVVKSENVENWAGLWMRVDGPETSTAFDNMQNRPIKGTQAWTRYSVVLDVDSKARYVAFGILLAGRGAVWINDVQFEAVGADVPVTDMKKYPPAPRNLGFNEGESPKQ